jgi:hypothetical protein
VIVKHPFASSDDPHDTPIADALIVLTNGGRASKALGIHGVTAALLVAAGLVLALA